MPFGLLLTSRFGWIGSALGSAYGRAARWRRRRARAAPALRHLRRPVISVGSLTIGGSGKTPAAGCVADLLRQIGERPAVLSRGYGRAVDADGVTVVRDAQGVRAALDVAGDEPLMLARRLAGIPVLVARDRHLAGVLAESRFGCSVHVLDDGFQHVGLARDLDLLLVREGDLEEARVVPAGRLREPAAAAAEAHAWLADPEEAVALRAIATRCGVGRVFTAVRALAPPRWLEEGAAPASPAAGRALLVSGVAMPERVEADMRAAGWAIVAHVAFRDHHRYTARDIRAIAGRLRAAAADLVVTTEKDAVRLERLCPLPFPVASVPLQMTIAPAEEFRDWLVQELARIRASRIEAPRSSRAPSSDAD
jgi:tetraacyldisaccharide 4'-kinase